MCQAAELLKPSRKSLFLLLEQSQMNSQNDKEDYDKNDRSKETNEYKQWNRKTRRNVEINREMPMTYRKRNPWTSKMEHKKCSAQENDKRTIDYGSHKTQ